VTQQAFQAAVARLVVDPAFRDRVRSTGTAALEDDLTSLEEQRLMSIADDRGLDATRTLHKSFRLTKLYATLPLTRQLLGPDRLAKEIGAFWEAIPSDSHYFLDESIAFCDFLKKRLGSGLRVKHLDEILAYERANLTLRRVRTDSKVPKPEVVRFHHDPITLFAQLVKGKRPRAVPKRICSMIGRVTKDGVVHWRLSEQALDEFRRG
jgi:hypothetical protein